MARTALVDVDGTLVDTNYQHALAWFRAFRHFDVTVPVWRIHRAIGMGGDKLVGAVAGDEVEDKYGDDLREQWSAQFQPMIDEITPLAGARDFLLALRDADYAVVLASSGKPEHIEHYLDLLDAREIVIGWTTADDVDDTKPAPDLLQVALDKAEGQAVTIGDSVWDCAAAGRLGLPSVCLLTGGFSAAELTDAGATSVYEDLPELTRHIAELPRRVSNQASADR